MCLCKCAGTSLGCMSPCKEQSSGWCLLSASQDIAQWPSKELVYTPTNIIWTPGLHLLFSLFYFFNQIMCVKWYLVLTCISLIITGEPDSLFICLLTIWVSNSLMCLFILIAFLLSFLGGVFFLLVYRISSCILATSPPNPRESSARKREGRRRCVWRGWWWDKKQPHLFYCSLKPLLKNWKANHKLRKNICNAHICQRTCILNI